MFHRFIRSRLFALLLIAGCAPLLASCYVPDEFRAEIRIARNGDFSLSYEGVLTWAQLYVDAVNGKISGKELQDKIEIVRRDIKRDPQFTYVRSMGRGQFEVKYTRTGNLNVRTGYVTFVRRNANILSIDNRPNGHVVVEAQTPNMDKLQPLADAGLLVRGSLRVYSELPVVGQSNATAIYSDAASGWTAYDWVFDGTRPLFPRIEFQR